MTPGTVVLLHAPRATAASWGDLPEMLRSHGLDVLAPDIPEDLGHRYIARASLAVAAAAPAPPLALVAQGAAGPLLPGLALAQRAAHRPVGAYVFLDAALPRPLQHDHDAPENDVPRPPDWPDAPCAYLRTPNTPDDDPFFKEARLRAWPTADHPRSAPLADSLAALLESL